MGNDLRGLCRPPAAIGIAVSAGRPRPFLSGAGLAKTRLFLRCSVVAYHNGETVPPMALRSSRPQDRVPTTYANRLRAGPTAVLCDAAQNIRRPFVARPRQPAVKVEALPCLIYVVKKWVAYL